MNQVGNFQSYKLVDNRDIIDLFDPTDKSIVSANIERIDIKSVKIGADVIKPANTATQVVLSADVLTGALLSQPNRLLNETKTISIGGSGIDFGNILGNAIGTSDNITLHNAVSILNNTGAAKLQTVLTENLNGINRGGFNVRLNGTIPTGQRLVMNLIIAIEASITYTRCEANSCIQHQPFNTSKDN
ncbi:MAG: hypothetical protein R2822_06950 [Spirosomataceae bacterium]